MSHGISEKIVFAFGGNQKNMRGCVFLDHNTTSSDQDDLLPPLCMSRDTTNFLYTYKGGLRSAIRVARVVAETVALNHTDVRWFVFGDDDTVFPGKSCKSSVQV